MKWSLIELQKYRNEPLLFSETVELKKSLMERDSEILDVSPIKIDGTLIVEKEEVIAHLVISLGLTMPSARSLKPVLVPMLIEANEIYVPKNVTDFAANEREETVIYLDKDLIGNGSVYSPINCQFITEHENKSAGAKATVDQYKRSGNKVWRSPHE